MRNPERSALLKVSGLLGSTVVAMGLGLSSACAQKNPIIEYNQPSAPLQTKAPFTGAGTPRCPLARRARHSLGRASNSGATPSVNRRWPVESMRRPSIAPSPGSSPIPPWSKPTAASRNSPGRYGNTWKAPSIRCAFARPGAPGAARAHPRRSRRALCGGCGCGGGDLGHGEQLRFAHGQQERDPLLATLAYEGRRPEFAHAQLLAALKILQHGDVPASFMIGSWAGAMGQTQFIPTTYNQYAVDFDGDGKRDIWGSPGDALASTANYLKASGWIAGQPWGSKSACRQASTIPWRNSPSASPWASGKGWAYKASTAAPALRALRRTGLAAAAGRAPRPGLPGAAQLPRHPQVQQLQCLCPGRRPARRQLQGGGRIVGAWPLEDVPLSRSQRIELQRQLAARGHDPGAVDGIIGANTRKAIRACQQEFGWPADGYPTPALLDRLRTP